MIPEKTKPMSRKDVRSHFESKMGKNHPGIDLHDKKAIANLIQETSDDDVRGALLHFWKTV